MFFFAIINSSVVISADTWCAFLFTQVQQDTAGRQQSANETTNKVSFIIAVSLNVPAFDSGALIMSLIEEVSTDVGFFEFRFVGCLHIQS